MTNQDAKQSGRTGSTTVIAIVPAVIAAIGAILAAWITAAAAMPQVVVVTQPAPLPPAPIVAPRLPLLRARRRAARRRRRAASVPEADAGYAASADPGADPAPPAREPSHTPAARPDVPAPPPPPPAHLDDEASIQTPQRATIVLATGIRYKATLLGLTATKVRFKTANQINAHTEYDRSEVQAIITTQGSYIYNKDEDRFESQGEAKKKRR